MIESIVDRLRVPDDVLRRSSDIATLEFERSDEIGAGDTNLGQDRAVDALRFGIQIEQEGYNVFVLGPPGSHRHGLAQELAEERASLIDAPDDWCYVHNFSDPETPRALSLPAGEGGRFRDGMADLIEEMRLAIPAAFEGDDYRNQLKAIEEATQEEVEEGTVHC